MQSWVNFTDFSSKPAEAILLLPRAEWTKNRIQNELIGLLKIIQMKPYSSIIIGDVPSDEAATYLAAIELSTKYKELAPNAKQVVLVTRDLKVCVLTRSDDEIFRKDIENKESYEFLRGQSSFEFDLKEYFVILRQHDGRRLWEIVRQEPFTYVKERIPWNERIELQGYLDFPQSLTHPVCREIYTVALHRLAGLFPRHDCYLIGLDPLVESLVVRFNAEQHPRYRGKGSHEQIMRLSIGSINVSGLTVRSARLEDSPVFHFFRHPNGTGKGRHLLPWIMPEKRHAGVRKISFPLSIYRRVGRTPVIARDGWKSYRMPRFLNDDAVPVYEQTPKESYYFWQEASRTPMKIGHWSYGGHHDLITVNIMLAFDTEIDRISLAFGGSLAKYVYGNLFKIFGLSQNDLNDKGKEILKAVLTDKYRHMFDDSIAMNKPLLLYPSHPVTDHIMDKFLSIIDEAKLQEVRTRLIPILPIRRHRSGSGLQISGLVMEKLANIPEPKPPVVFFDDAVISGRTHAELRSLLNSLNFEDIYSLLLLDRQRLPSADHIDGTRNLCYWRLDVPAIGTKNNCPLCIARKRARDLADILCGVDYKHRVESWRDSWRSVNPATQWGDGGVRPIPLWLEKPHRKFGIVQVTGKPNCYKQIGGDEQQIVVKNTAGLVSYVAELHSITSRDDLSIRMLEKEKLEPEARIQLLVSQLLLFAGEYDKSLAIELGRRLLLALWEAEHHDRHTALAALSLISCGDTFLVETVDGFMTDLMLEATKSRNIDLLILLAFAINIDKKLSSRSGKTPKLTKLEPLESVYSLLKPYDKMDVYRRLHREVKDALGKCHSSPLHRLKKAAQDPEVLTERGIRSILGSIDQLQSLLDAIPRYRLRRASEGQNNYAKIVQEIQSLSDKTRQALKNIQSMLLSQNATQVHVSEAKGYAELLLEQADKLHFGLLLPLGLNNMRDAEFPHEPAIYRELSELVQNLPANISAIISIHKPTLYDRQLFVKELTSLKTEIIEVYLVWDSEIMDAVQDIITNARHSVGTIIDNPFKNADKNEKAGLWMSINLMSCFCEMQLVNRSSKSAEEVTKLTANSYSHTVLRSIGGEVKYKDLEFGLMATHIYLPYAHTLGTHSWG